MSIIILISIVPLHIIFTSIILEQAAVYDLPNMLTYTTLEPVSKQTSIPNNDGLGGLPSFESSNLLPVLSSTFCELEASETIENSSETNDEPEANDDEEYEPEKRNSSDSESSSCEESIHRKSDRTERNLLNISLGMNKPGVSAPDDASLMVATSATPSYSKKYFCFYCHKFQVKIARHLEAIHGKEEDVKKFTLLPPKSKKRKAMIALIRKKGNHLFNNDKRFNTGELLVCRRPNQRMQKTAEDFLACGNCKGQYSRSRIGQHFSECTGTSGKFEHIAVSSGKKATARIHEKANVLVRKWIFPYLREDSIVRGIRYDELMILYANKECDKYGAHQHHYPMVRARLRLLGRFFEAIRKIKPAMKVFEDVYMPRHYDSAIEAVRVVANFDEETRTFEHPAVASNLGTLIKYCGEILRSEKIKNGSAPEQKQVEDFLKLMSEGFGTSINRAVTETQAQLNRRKKVVLPSMEDIKKLDTFITTERIKYFNELEEKYTFDSWKKLRNDITLAANFQSSAPGRNRKNLPAGF